MSANVARTAADRRGFALGGRAARVTHTLLVIAVTVVPPGVRSICLGCPPPGGLRACCAAPTDGAAPPGAVAATQCCGSHANAHPGAPSADRAPTTSVADGDDGGPHSPTGCRCSLSPRGSAGEGPVPRPVGAAVALLLLATVPAPVAMPVAAVVAPDAAAFAPPRPVRVLYGVWRN